MHTWQFDLPVPQMQNRLEIRQKMVLCDLTIKDDFNYTFVMFRLYCTRYCPWGQTNQTKTPIINLHFKFYTVLIIHDTWLDNTFCVMLRGSFNSSWTILIFSMENEHPDNRNHHGSSGGMPNRGYHSPDYPDRRSSGHPRVDYHHGYSGDHSSSPPPYNGYSHNDNVSGPAKKYHNQY